MESGNSKALLTTEERDTLSRLWHSIGAVGVCLAALQESNENVKPFLIDALTHSTGRLDAVLEELGVPRVPKYQ